MSDNPLGLSEWPTSNGRNLYSMICRNRHVLDDEITTESPLEHNERTRCTKGDCDAPIYSHCKTCDEPIRGLTNAFHKDSRGRTQAGRIAIGPGGPRREFPETCHSCTSPYPWATDGALARYHAEHLKDVKRGTVSPLPLNLDAKAVYEARAKNARKRKKGERKAERAEGNERKLTRAQALIALLIAVVALMTATLTLGDDVKEKFFGGESENTPAEVEEPEEPG